MTGVLSRHVGLSQHAAPTAFGDDWDTSRVQKGNRRLAQFPPTPSSTWGFQVDETPFVEDTKLSSMTKFFFHYGNPIGGQINPDGWAGCQWGNIYNRWMPLLEDPANYDSVEQLFHHGLAGGNPGALAAGSALLAFACPPASASGDANPLPQASRHARAFLTGPLSRFGGSESSQAGIGAGLLSSATLRFL
mmetsp:Transcript_147267/g.274335  ORF Transcript_147267/g.274335 Transcript_147267/m.274335 type:complete len:191 (+) Transcript_147267:99-671(+)